MRPNSVKSQIRALAKEVIPPALETYGAMNLQDIYARVSASSNGLCDDSIPCQHEKLSSPRPEWQHITRSALDHLQHKKIVKRVPPKWEVA